MFRELLHLIREFFTLHAEIFGLPRNVEYQDVSPEVIAEASRKKEELWQAVVWANQRTMLTFVVFPIIFIIFTPVMPDIMRGLLMFVFAGVFTYCVMYVMIETNRYRYFRCPRCGSIFREFNKLFPDTDHCRVCKLDLTYRDGGKNQDEKKT
jgi:hypothetical protein